MDLQQLRYFLAVVEHGNFSRAAEALGRSQQALSKGVQALEHQLGERLLVRGTRQAHLTPAGRLLLEHARSIHDSALRFGQRLAEMQTGAEGQLRIGAGPSTAAALVAPAVQTLRRQWPKLSVHVSGGIFPELLPALLAHELDLVVALDTRGDADVDARVHSEVLVEDEYRVLAHASHPLAGPDRVTATALAREPWVFGHRLGEVAGEFAALFQTAGLTPPRPLLESSSLEFLRAMVSEGGCLTLLPARLAHAELRSGLWAALPVPGFRWRRPVRVHTRAGEPQSAPLARLMQGLRRVAARRG